MPEQFDFYACLICDGLEAYAAACGLLIENPFCESSFVDVQADPEVLEFLLEKFPDYPEEGLPVSDVVYAVAEKFPPPLSPSDIVELKYAQRPPRNLRKLLTQDKTARKKNRLEVHITLKQPADLETTVALKAFLKVYKPMMRDMMNEYVGLLDDYTATDAQIRGKKTGIEPEELSFVLSLPFRDVTNSVKLFEITSGLKRKGELPYPDPYYLLVHAPNPKFAHLLCYMFGELSNAFDHLAWDVLVVERKSDNPGRGTVNRKSAQ